MNLALRTPAATMQAAIRPEIHSMDATCAIASTASAAASSETPQRLPRQHSCAALEDSAA